MRVVYTQHLSDKLRERNFPQDFPKRIFYRPDLKFKDTERESCVSIRKLPYYGRIRYISIFFEYDKNEKSVKIMTIHPETHKEIENRVEKGRYIVR